MRLRVAKLFVATVVFSATVSMLTDVYAGSQSRKAEKIAKKHASAIGGAKAIKNLKDMRIVGELETQGIELEFTLWMKRPNLSRMDLDMQGQTIIQAFDGKMAWWTNPFAGAAAPQEMPQQFAQEYMHWVDFDGPLIDYRKKGRKLEYEGEADVEGQGAAHKIEVTFADGEIWYVFIDKETYMETAREWEHSFNGNTSTVTTYFSDFKEVDGVTTATLVRGIALTGSPFTMRFTSFDSNTAMDSERFKLPVYEGRLDSSDPSEPTAAPEQPSYVSMTTIDDITQRFNKDEDNVRAVSILSPT